MTTTSTIRSARPAHTLRAATFHFTSCLTAWLLCAVFLLTAITLSRTPCNAEEVDLPSRLPGLVAEFKTATGERARRVDVMMQHKWTNPQQLDERLDESKPVEITWEGLLELKAEGRYQLHVFAAGQFQLTLGGQEIAAGQHDSGGWFASRTVDLPFGFHPLKLRFNGSQPVGTVALYWQGPGFELEPISERYLAHPSGETAADDFQRGRLLAHALRCAACHDSARLAAPLAAPELTRLAGNLEASWLHDWLTSKPAERVPDDVTVNDQIQRRMPHFAISDSDAADIVAALWSASLPAEVNSTPSQRTTSKPKTKSETAGKSQDKPLPPRTKPDAEHGRVVFDTRGCVACHSMAEREISGVDTDDEATYLPHNRLSRLSRELFDGGDLSRIASKRPVDFFARWLAEPANINADHRMPLAELDELERADVSVYLATLKGQANETQSDDQSKDSALPKHNSRSKGNALRGEKLLVEHRCAACHKLPQKLATSALDLRELTAQSDWDAGCLAEPVASRNVPGFGLTAEQRRCVKNYWLSTQLVSGKASEKVRLQRTTPPDLLLSQNNCIACHARGAEQGIGARVADVVAVEKDLATRLPTLIPPSLTGVGDKLHDHALQAAIERREEPRRPWLEVQMPKYAMDSAERTRLVEHLITQDRIPEREPQNVKLPDDVVTRAAAGRLLTSEGFGCQSCHQIGSQLPPTVALSARGTDLTMLGGRIRHTWFDRWVRNPVRIVPRMEMPAIQLPVHGVLGDDLGRQIDAVWEMLNTQGFQPPTPAPVRIVRGHNLAGKAEAAHVLTDVLETSGRNYLRPLIIGLGNRHNLLFDLEKAEFARWWIGDTARELTRGKSWYWEIGGQPLAQKLESLGKLILVDDQGRVWGAVPIEQFATELDAMQHTPAGVRWQGRITFGLGSDRRVIPIAMALEPIISSAATSATSGMSLVLTATLPSGHALGLQLDPLAAPLLSPAQSADQRPDGEKQPTWSTQLDERSRLSLSSTTGHAVVRSEHQWQVGSREPGQPVGLSLRLETEWTVDRFVDAPVSAIAPSAGADRRTDIQTARAEPLKSQPLKSEPLKTEAIKLDVVPGFDAVQLPLPRDEMPTALAWHRGELIVGSLKGRVCRAIDSDGDGFAETWQAISDDFPAPYGIASHGDDIDVLVKFGLVRLTKPDDPALPWSWRVVADGWGYTADYHDWAVGLPKDKANNYFVALPCQQDDRTPSSARLRGTIQKLIPQSPTSEHPREYRLETFAAGQRFPMGVAFNREGELFATDNQGNYNPFNELNHLQLGKRYGFINKLEVKPGFNPPLESPAVNLPHPWTRSVNGICFLNTPPTAGSSAGFGPYEGHLVGCEYNGLSLIRMSFEMVDGVYQGAAYLFSRAPENGEPTFEGPVVCEVSPSGELTVGNIHDSGWGGGQNTGSIVRLTPNGRWPLGIATVSATEEGLSVQFTGEIDPAAASQAANYTLRSYRRLSTPAYGGADQEEREEKVLEARVEPGNTCVKLRLKDLRADSVYELRVGAVAGPSTKLFPAEAHYTMKRVPTTANKKP